MKKQVVEEAKREMQMGLRIANRMRRGRVEKRGMPKDPTTTKRLGKRKGKGPRKEIGSTLKRINDSKETSPLPMTDAISGGAIAKGEDWYGEGETIRSIKKIPNGKGRATKTPDSNIRWYGKPFQCR